MHPAQQITIEKFVSGRGRSKIRKMSGKNITVVSFEEEDATTLFVVQIKHDAISASFPWCVERLLDREGRLTDEYTCRAQIDTSSRSGELS